MMIQIIKIIKLSCVYLSMQLLNASNEISIDIIVKPTADYTRTVWDLTDFNIFTVTITNTSETTSTYYAKVLLSHTSGESFSGDSKNFTLPPNGEYIFIDKDLQGDNINDTFFGQASGWTSEFMTKLFQTGYLLEGTYELEVSVYKSYDCKEAFTEKECLSMNCEWYEGETYEEYLAGGGSPDDIACTDLDYIEGQSLATKVVKFEKNELNKIITFGNSIIDEESPTNIVLEWKTEIPEETIYFQPEFPLYGIEYRFQLAVYIPNVHTTKEDAFLNTIYSIFDNDDWGRIGQYQNWPLNLQQANNFRLEFSTLLLEDFYCGYEYVYRVSAREIIDGMDGIWGFSYPVESEIKSFKYGSKPVLNNMSNSNNYPNVLPFFSWEVPTDSLECDESINEGFIIEISSPDDDSFIKEFSSSLPHAFFQYPSNETGFSPGQTYKWRARRNPNTMFSIDHLWTEPVTFTIQSIEVLNPISENPPENDTRPTFEITGPANISYYSILIGDENDEKVEVSEIYNQISEITTFPGTWTYPSEEITEELYPNQRYYWKLVLNDEQENVLNYNPNQSDDDKVQKFDISRIFLINPSNGSENNQRNTTFEWIGPDNVSGYRFLLSDNEDKEIENEQISIDTETTPSGTQTFSYPFDGDYPLDYEKSYYWKIIPVSQDGVEGPPSSHSEIWEFKTSNYPTIGESVEASALDSRIPVINIESSNFDNIDEIEFIISIYRDIDRQNILDEIIIKTLTEFPYSYSTGPDIFDYGLTYYIQIQPIKDGQNYGPVSTTLPFIIPLFSDNLQCIISCEFIPNEEPEILTSVLNDLDQASEYLVLFSETADMAETLFSETIQGGQTQISISDNIEWGKTYYTQVIPLNADGDEFGASEITSVSVDEKPGMNEQTALEVVVSSGSINPSFNIFNEITGANEYQITVSNDPEMSTVYAQFMTNNSPTIDYPENEESLKFGTSYYATAQGFDNDIVHGIKSSIVPFFIQNITPPELISEDLFKWNPSIPVPIKYLLEVSLLEDFSSLVLEVDLDDNFYTFNINQFEYNKSYYWRVTPKDSEGNNFGNSSKIGFFKTDSPPKPILNDLTSEVSILPTFSWQGIDIASKYQISVSLNQTIEDIIWQQNNVTNTSIQYPQSAKILDFSNQYFWEIIAFGEDENIISVSDIGSFVTQSTYPVVGLRPDGGIETLSPTLEWDKNEKANSYKILLSANEDMSSPIINETSDVNSYSLESEILEQGNQYYWQVDGLNENNESLAGPSNIAIILMPSTNSIPIISPSNSEKLNTLTPLFKWGALIGTSTYNLHISTDADFNDKKVDKQVSGTEHLLPEENKLDNSINYFWRIEGVNDNDIIYSNVGNFSTPDIAEIVIQKLDDGAEISLFNPVFSWKSDSDIPLFEFRIADNSDFSDGITFPPIGSNTFTYPDEATDLKLDTEYFWQIRPLNNEGMQTGNWTPVRKFSINLSSIVELSSPANEETLQTSTPTFEWSAIDNAIKYEIQVSKTKDFSELLWNSVEIVENSVSYPNSGSERLLYDIDYFWRVRALGENAPLGDFSNPIYTFKISGAFKIELEGPLKESDNLKPYFSWIPINKADSYKLILGSDENLNTIIYTTETTEVFYQYLASNPPLNFNSTLYWQVFALDENGQSFGDPSDIGQFSTPSGFIQLEFIFGKD